MLVTVTVLRGGEGVEVGLGGGVVAGVCRHEVRVARKLLYGAH